MKYEYWLDGEWSNETSLGNSLTSGGIVHAGDISELKQRMKELVARQLRAVGGTVWDGKVTVTRIDETLIVSEKEYKLMIETNTVEVVSL